MPDQVVRAVEVGAFGDRAGQLRQQKVVSAGMVAQDSEGVVDVYLHPFGEDSLGLLDHDPAGQGPLELFRQRAAAGEGALVQDPAGRGLGQRPSEVDVRVGERLGGCREEGERPDDGVAQPERQRVG